MKNKVLKLLDFIGGQAYLENAFPGIKFEEHTSFGATQVDISFPKYLNGFDYIYINKLTPVKTNEGKSVDRYEVHFESTDSTVSSRNIRTSVIRADQVNYKISAILNFEFPEIQSNESKVIVYSVSDQGREKFQKIGRHKLRNFSIDDLKEQAEDLYRNPSKDETGLAFELLIQLLEEKLPENEFIEFTEHLDSIE